MKDSISVSKGMAGYIASVLVAASLVVWPFGQSTASANSLASIEDNNCDLSGAPASSYTISSAWDLWEIVDCDGADKTFTVDRNIDLSGVTNSPTTSPIGSYKSASTPLAFTGTFDGGGYKISGVSMSSSAKRVGLFGLLTNATIKNLEIEGQVSFTFSGTHYASAGLAANASGQVTLSNLVNSVEVRGVQRVGGFIGEVNSSVGGAITAISISNNASISGTLHVGGFFGSVQGIVVTNSENSGSVFSSGSNAGGFAGSTGGTIAVIGNSTNSNNISASTASAGGFIGRAGSGVSISGSVNIGDVQANGADFSGNSNVGGFIGFLGSVTSNFFRARNEGAVTASLTSAGGLVGFSEGSINATDSSNLGEIVGPKYVGGLIGNGISTTIRTSFNSATVSGQEYIGGFLGFGRGVVNLEIRDSFNSGTISGSAPVSGFANPGGPSQFINSYQVGLVAGSNPKAFSNQAVTLTSVFTNQNLDYSTVSPDAQLRDATTFVGWDLETIWGFPSCSVGNGFPVLRFSAVGQTLSSTSCAVTDDLIAQAQAAQNTPAQAPAIDTPAPSYTGPTANKLAYPVTAGTSVSFTGSKLDQVSSAMFGTTAVIISSLTSGSLTVVVPSSLGAATYDLVLFSSFGTLTVMQAVTVRTATATVDSKPSELIAWNWVPRFSGNSRSLSNAQAQVVETTVNKYPEATTVICWGYTTTANPNSWALAHATARAKAACDLLTTKKPMLKTVVRVRTGVEKSWAIRAALQFWK